MMNACPDDDDAGPIGEPGKSKIPNGTRQGSVDDLVGFLQKGALRLQDGTLTCPENIKEVMAQPKRVDAFDQWRQENMGYGFKPSSEIGPKLVTQLPKSPSPDDEIDQLIESGRLVKHPKTGEWILAEKLKKKN